MEADDEHLAAGGPRDAVARALAEVVAVDELLHVSDLSSGTGLVQAKTVY